MSLYSVDSGEVGLTGWELHWEGSRRFSQIAWICLLEKFSDVVAWVRENSSEAKVISTKEPPSHDNNLLEGTEKNKPNEPFEIQRGIGSNISFGSPEPLSHGIQASNQLKSDTGNDVDEENDANRPSSPSVKKTEEKGIVLVHEVRCKVYLKPDNTSDKSWKDMGMGMLSLKCKEGIPKGTKESKPTIIIRNNAGKILLNALVYPGIKLNVQKNTITTIFHTSGNGDMGGVEDKTDVAVVPRTYLLRTKVEEEVKKLAETIEECVPTS
ncbi:RanBP1 domain containing protein, expressed [Zostera marina]|uniref:RanBP1 domain containing protein, expressed n=1 Tax=Zostera marina TaxID=29655 RepID=A0A0K9PYN3_ZOSMR|nr:RanBP1 domain containing protein, expressed [Zostera marina]